jgi:hypothetical protein
VSSGPHGGVKYFTPGGRIWLPILWKFVTPNSLTICLCPTCILQEMSQNYILLKVFIKKVF